LKPSEEPKPVVTRKLCLN